MNITCRNLEMGRPHRNVWSLEILAFSFSQVLRKYKCQTNHETIPRTNTSQLYHQLALTCQYRRWRNAIIIIIRVYFNNILRQDNIKGWFTSCRFYSISISRCVGFLFNLRIINFISLLLKLPVGKSQLIFMSWQTS